MNTVTLAVLMYNQKGWVEDILSDCVAQGADVLIFSDDASTDGTFEEITKVISRLKPMIRAKLIVRKNVTNQGIVGHVNAILQLVETELFTLVAGDDRLHPEYVRCLKKSFVSDVTAATVNQLRINEQGRIIDRSDWAEGSVRKLREIVESEGFGVPSAGTMFRTSSIIKYGPISQHLLNEDDQILFRALVEGRRNVLKDYLFYYRVHSGSLSAWHRNFLMPSNELKIAIRREENNRISNLYSWRSVLLESSLAEQQVEDLCRLIDIRIKLHNKKILDISRNRQNFGAQALKDVSLRAPLLVRAMRFRIGRLKRYVSRMLS
jgi:glycosyltransferase involved in cell wall biosynthesis